MVVLQGDEMITADDESVRAQSETLAIAISLNSFLAIRLYSFSFMAV